MTEQVDIIVIGAGVVGLAIARALQQAGRDVLLLEAEEREGTGVSSRNSGVIHAGFYYPSGSLKARLCVRGKQMLYDFCESHGVLHKRTGKLVVATELKGMEKLEALVAQGQANGVDDLVILDKAEVQKREPEVRAEAAIWSPSTGIVDAHELMLALLGDFENAGGTMAVNTPVTRIVPTGNGLEVHTGGDAPFSLIANTVINSAGLGAQDVARGIEGMSADLIPPQFLGKGNYFALEGKAPFDTLIYPLPRKASLGAHSFVDFGGRTRFGPDCVFVDDLDYRVDHARKADFVRMIRDYYPGLDERKLHADFTGIRPKIVGPDQGVTDFMIQTEGDHGIPGLINLFGIESPGLTSSMAIGEYLVERLSPP